VILDDAPVDPATFAAGTGWELKPEGACQGEICVPLPDAAVGDAVDVDAVAGRLGMPIVEAPGRGLRAVGPATLGGRALATVAAPDLELPLVVTDGTWRLADQRGRRSVIVAWAPW
jgi:hypothetical protein